MLVLIPHTDKSIAKELAAEYMETYTKYKTYLNLPLKRWDYSPFYRAMCISSMEIKMRNIIVQMQRLNLL